VSDQSCSPPLVSMVLITYNQEGTAAQAVQAALAQRYHPLEIIVSDDASCDTTAERIGALLRTYAGPHKVVFQRNDRNLGIGANLSQAVSLSSGDLIVIAAGDDVSVPERCERVARAWVDAGRRPDLISSHLLDLDQEGCTHGLIAPTDLSKYRSVQDWLADRPHIIGAAQAWTRRLFDHFGPLPSGVVAEDLIMVFRAICRGGCITIPEPLVQYRRGGLSGRTRAMHAQDTVRRLLVNNRHTLVELPLLKADAQKAGCAPEIRSWLDREMALAVFIQEVFQAQGVMAKCHIALNADQVSLSRRLRMLTYAAWPWVLAPLFALKRWVVR
jgi:glycosyltransferase involved in cell wall biosynthesis